MGASKEIWLHSAVSQNNIKILFTQLLEIPDAQSSMSPVKLESHNLHSYDVVLQQLCKMKQLNGSNNNKNNLQSIYDNNNNYYSASKQSKWTDSLIQYGSRSSQHYVAAAGGVN